MGGIIITEGREVLCGALAGTHLESGGGLRDGIATDAADAQRGVAGRAAGIAPAGGLEALGIFLARAQLVFDEGVAGAGSRRVRRQDFLFFLLDAFQVADVEVIGLQVLQRGVDVADDGVVHLGPLQRAAGVEAHGRGLFADDLGLLELGVEGRDLLGVVLLEQAVAAG